MTTQEQSTNQHQQQQMHQQQQQQHQYQQHHQSHSHPPLHHPPLASQDRLPQLMHADALAQQQMQHVTAKFNENKLTSMHKQSMQDVPPAGAGQESGSQPPQLPSATRSLKQQQLPSVRAPQVPLHTWQQPPTHPWGISHHATTPPHGQRRLSFSEGGTGGGTIPAAAGGQPSSWSSQWDAELQHSNSPRLVQGIGSPLHSTDSTLRQLGGGAGGSGGGGGEGGGGGGAHPHELSPDPLRHHPVLPPPWQPGEQHAPLFATTLERDIGAPWQPRSTGGSASSSRRSSITRMMDTDEDTAAASAAAAHEGGSSLGLTPPGQQRRLLQLNTSLPSSMLPTPASTPSSSGAAMSAGSSVPTSPLRRFPYDSAFWPVHTGLKLVTSLVPSPRGRMTNLQRVGRQVERMRAKLKSEEGGEEEEEFDEDGDEDSGAAANGGAAAGYSKKRSLSGSANGASSANKKPRKKKMSRPRGLVTEGDAGGNGAGGVPEEGEETASPADELKAAKTLSRISRRRSLPPVHFGDDDPFAAERGRATTDPGMDSAAAAAAGASSKPRSPSPPRDKDCEVCSHKHSGTYGGGRFCSAKCARHFSIRKRWDSKHTN
jgi:hypothetical protein